MSRRSELEKAILNHLLLHGKVTRPELVSMTGIRAATVFEAVDALKADRKITEPERRGRRTGRRAPELEINPDYCHFAGVELRPAGCIGVIIDASGRILHKSSTRAERRESLGAVKREILQLLQKLHDQAGENWKLVKGLGFADPGLVDIGERFSIRAVNVPEWRELETGRYLEQVSGVSAGVWPEAMVKTQMEYLKLIGEKPESIFHLATDGGIGGGFIKNGELFIGNSNRAMEIGHLTVAPGGTRCRCGNCGCLEAVAGVEALAAKIAAARADGVDFGSLPEKFSMKSFASCIEHNKGVRIIADELCRDLGQALSVVVMLLNPERIVITGEFTHLGDFLLDSLRRELELRCFPEAVKRLKITLSALENTDTARGAAVMIREKILLNN